jgi:hypothetical protein
MSVQRRLVDDGDGWIVEERIFSKDVESAKSARSYYFRDQLAVRHELKTVGARRLAGLALIEKDLRTLTAWVEALIAMTVALMPARVPEKASALFMPNDERTLIARGLYVAVLATYGKMFTEAEGRGTTLHRTDCGPAPEHLRLHEWLMHQRHTFVAHSGLESDEGCQIAIAIDHKLRTPMKLFTELHQPVVIDPNALERIADLLKLLHTNVSAKLDKATAFAYSEAQKQLTDSTLKKAVKGARGWWLQRGKDALTPKRKRDAEREADPQRGHAQAGSTVAKELPANRMRTGRRLSALAVRLVASSTQPSQAKRR